MKPKSNWIGQKITPPGPATWISREWRKMIAGMLSGVCNFKLMVKWLGTDGVSTMTRNADVQFDENGLVATLDLKDMQMGGSGGSLELTDGTTDLTGVTKITVSGAVVGGTSSAATLTISGGSGGSVQQFQLAANGGVVDGGDFWWAKAWDGTTLSGTFTKIAKQYKQRCVNGPTSDSIGGVSYNYTYALDGSYPRYIRTTSISGGPFSGSTTTDYIEPQGLAGDVIYAIPFSTASPGTLSAVTLIEIGPMRDWITYPS